MNETTQLSKEDAIHYTTNWRRYYDGLLSSFIKDRVHNANGDDIFRGFRIPIADLKGLLEDAGYTLTKHDAAPDIEHVRAYLAMKQPQQDMDLILVPVNNENEDVLSIQGKVSIYNFTSPCPDACSDSSPLFKSAVADK